MIGLVGTVALLHLHGGHLGHSTHLPVLEGVKEIGQDQEANPTVNARGGQKDLAAGGVPETHGHTDHGDDEEEGH